MVHYLEVTTTAALLAILCPFMVMAQEVFQAEVINLFSLLWKDVIIASCAGAPLGWVFRHPSLDITYEYWDISNLAMTSIFK